MRPMDLPVTLGLMAVFAATGLACGYRFLMLLAAFGFIALSAHALGLVGIVTGGNRSRF